MSKRKKSNKKNSSVFDRKLEKPVEIEKISKRIDYDYFCICFFMFIFAFLFLYSLARDFLKIFFNVPVH